MRIAMVAALVQHVASEMVVLTRSGTMPARPIKHHLTCNYQRCTVITTNKAAADLSCANSKSVGTLAGRPTISAFLIFSAASKSWEQHRAMSKYESSCSYPAPAVPPGSKG